MPVQKSLSDHKIAQSDDASPQELWNTVSQLTAALFGDTAGGVTTTPADAAAPVRSTDAVAGELLVRFSAAHGGTGLAEAIQHVFGEALEVIRSHELGASAPGATDSGLVRVRIGGGLGLDRAIDILSHQAGVELVERNGIATIQLTSNDPQYSSGGMWGMYGDQTTPANAYGSQAAEAWAAGRVGASSVVTGVNDTGIDYTHPDLYLNVWLNQGEIPLAFRSALQDRDGDARLTFRDLNAKDAAGQLVYRDFVSDLNANGYIDGGDLLGDTRWENVTDEDGNGYRDDLIGWDFVNNDNDPFDDNGHGTHVSGTIGAVGGNAQGVAGVNWNTSIIALKTMNSQGSGYYSNAIKATDYYSALSDLSPSSHFVAINNSWSGTSSSQALLDSIVNAARHGVLFVAAAGNGGSDQIGDNNDSTGNYPSNFSTLSAAGYDSVVAVGALTSAGALGSYSNYGNVSVDLAAPGSSILSTVRGGGYGYMSGTSMATPHVTGAVALYAAAHPDATAQEIVQALKDSTARMDSLVAKTAWDGRLDIGTLMGGSTPPVVVPPSAPTQTVVINSISDNVNPVSGTVANGGVTNDTTPTLNGSLSGSLLTGQSLAIYRAASGATAVKAGVATVSGTAWSYVDTALADGSYTYTARVEDAAGANGASAAAYAIVEDATAPAQSVTIASMTDGTNTVASGGTTTDTTPTFNGTLTTALGSGEKLVLMRDGAVITTQQFAGTSWSYTDTTSTGAHTYTGLVEDGAGNRGAPSAGFVLNVATATGGTGPSFYGTTASDTVTGDAGNNVVSGIPASGSFSGRGTIDTLVGGGGGDTFVLADAARGIFYQDGVTTNQGFGDYAIISDFQSGLDHIQLKGVARYYTYSATSLNGVSGLGIYFDSNADGKYSVPDELIGLVANVSSLAAGDLLYV